MPVGRRSKATPRRPLALLRSDAKDFAADEADREEMRIVREQLARLGPRPQSTDGYATR
jgi:hypothetical protein